MADRGMSVGRGIGYGLSFTVAVIGATGIAVGSIFAATMLGSLEARPDLEIGIVFCAVGTGLLLLGTLPASLIRFGAPGGILAIGIVLAAASGSALAWASGMRDGIARAYATGYETARSVDVDFVAAASGFTAAGLLGIVLAAAAFAAFFAWTDRRPRAQEFEEPHVVTQPR